VGLFLGIALIALFTNIFGDSTNMILNVTLFILSSSRIVPALLRIQYFLTTLTKAVAQSSIIFEILKDEKNKNSADLEIESEILRNKLSDFIPSVAVEKVSFAYPNNPAGNVITDISLRIGKGQFLSIVGRSGSGKSTLLDLILGNLEPATGTIFVSGVSPVVASQVWPRKISYVPQKVTILSGDIYENIALGQSKDLISRNLVEQVLKNVQLFDYFNSIPEGFGKNLGELGSHLSGGQLQRIGIARALYSDSELLVFDESMSALDAQSEAAILEILSRYRGDKTIIMVTHRLSALQQVDTIVYMDSGKILCTGDFLAVQQQVPDFAEQVKLQSFDLWKIEE
jgi:ATP-binding cassette subfamily C protein